MEQLSDKIKNIAIKLCYDGTNYYGWNIQPNLPTIQGELIKAINRITQRTDTKVKGASRTDKGVHALGQVANFLTSSNIPPEKFKDALNSVLPKDIRVIESKEVPINFDSRKWAKVKTYRYIIYKGEITPFTKNYALHIKKELNLDVMKKVARLFEGERDFHNFTPEKGFTTRTVFRSEITEKGNFLIYEISGRGFLRYMVRNIVGTLIMTGLGKISEEYVKELLYLKIIQKTPLFCAPPHGLYLVNIQY